ncbi:MAG: hypothetical protein KVP17_004303 [Porospora cf. gigantea B]|uniref:uncharacterized protein n=2 Tax=Porospora cf. gigantea B TaxID=2853592 RepID=UPI003571EE87|nr:MAG: hypothetical protein KVP17_004303 [Porospora cf. gigantea B]
MPSRSEPDLKYLMESCGSDIVPVFSCDMLQIMLELGSIVNGKEVFSLASLAKIRRICLGLHPFPGRVSMLFAHSRLRGALAAFGDPVLEDRFSLGATKSFLTEPRSATACYSLFDRSRRSLLWKIRDAGDRTENAYVLWSWIVVDTELFLATQKGTAAKEEVASHVLELISMMASAKGEPGLAAVCLFMMDAILARQFRSMHKMMGWQAVDSLMSLLGLKPTIRLHPQERMDTLEAGMDFGRRITFKRGFGPILPPNIGDIQEPGAFVVDNDLLFLLTENRWIHGGQPGEPSEFQEVAVADLDKLVRSSTKRFNTSTRLVNMTLRLVTELAAEEGIELSEEEKTRLLQDIAASDRRGVMSRAWESSPIKGSVPPMIQDFTKKPRVREDPWIAYLKKQLSSKTSLGSFAHLALVGFTTLDLLRDRAFGDHVDYEPILAAFEPALMAKLSERPRCSLAQTFPGFYTQFVEQVADPSRRPIRQNLPMNVVVGVFPSLAAMLNLPTALSQLTPPPPTKPLLSDVNINASASPKASTSPRVSRAGASHKVRRSGHKSEPPVSPLRLVSPVTSTMLDAASLVLPGRALVSETSDRYDDGVSIGTLAIRTTPTPRTTSKRFG